MALHVYEVSLEMIVAVRPLLVTVARSDSALADQMRRAASSVALNVAEGSESLGGNQRARFKTALGSAAEVSAALDVAAAWGYVAAQEVATVHELLARVRAMLARLAR